jgi:hypothetical protein
MATLSKLDAHFRCYDEVLFRKVADRIAFEIVERIGKIADVIRIAREFLENTTSKNPVQKNRHHLR